MKRGDQVAWSKTSSLETVLKMMRKNTPIITRMSYEEHGKLSEATIYSAEIANSKKYIKTKISDEKLKIERYGGFTNCTGAYFFLVEHTQKEKRVRTLEALPLYLKHELNTKEKLRTWCADRINGLGLVDPDIRLEKIKLYSKLRLDGFDLYLTGRSDDNLRTCNAVQFKMGSEIKREDIFWRFYIDKLSKYGDNRSEIVSVEKNNQLFDILIELNRHGIYSKRQNPIGNKLVGGRDKFRHLEIEKQVETLIGIIRMFGLENNGADLRNIGGQKQNGTMKPHKRITDKTQVLLINQSVTGLYENTIDLLTI